MEILGGIAVMTIALYFLTRPSQEDRDRWSEIREQGKAERKAELKKFMRYLQKSNLKNFVIYQFGKDDDQQYYVKLVKNKLTMNLIQLIIAHFDFLYNWNRMNMAQQWIELAAPNIPKHIFRPS